MMDMYNILFVGSAIDNETIDGKTERLLQRHDAGNPAEDFETQGRDQHSIHGYSDEDQPILMRKSRR